MTYALSRPLQAAIYARLASDPTLGALVGSHVYDQLPPGALPPLFVALGPEAARDRSDQTGRGTEHDLTVSVVAEAAGFSAAKEAAGAVSDALLGADLALSRGRLVNLRFLRAQARRREAGEGREITLIFRARVEDDAGLQP